MRRGDAAKRGSNQNTDLDDDELSTHDFLVPAISIFLISVAAALLGSLTFQNEAAFSTAEPRAWRRQILVGGSMNHIDTTTAKSILDNETSSSIEPSLVLQWYGQKPTLSSKLEIAFLELVIDIGVDTRRYVQLLPDADIVDVETSSGESLGPYFPHDTWLLCGDRRAAASIAGMHGNVAWVGLRPPSHKISQGLDVIMEVYPSSFPRVKGSHRHMRRIHYQRIHLFSTLVSS